MSKTPLCSSRKGLPLNVFSPSLCFVSSALDGSLANTSCWRFSDEGPKSKCPSCIRTILRVLSSLRKVEIYCCIAPATILSGPCDGGARDGLIDDVRNKRVDLWDARRGRKACTVVKGASILLFKMSDHSGEDMFTMAPVGYVGAGSTMKPAR